MSASPPMRPVERRILLNIPNREVRASTRSTGYSTPKGLPAQTRARDRDPVLGSAALCAQGARWFGRPVLAVALGLR
jgi:hypothetical protein